MDACGVGALPDAAAYGDPVDANTLAHVAEAVGGLDLPTLGALGLGNITSIEGVPPVDHPVVHGRLHPLGPGKESTTGHWELMGVIPQHPLPTYPEGLPAGRRERLEEATGHRFCCNRPYSGTEVIEDWGPHHLETGELILYTSADSVLQLAVHTDVLSEPELYAVCEAAREVMTGENAVGRVIARPFDGRAGQLPPPRGPPRLRGSAAGPLLSRGDPGSGPARARRGEDPRPVRGSGDHREAPGGTNAKGIEATTRLLEELDAGLIFVNLVETDQVYGHRHDVEGFHEALKEIDAAVAGWLALLRDDDLLVLTADHGVDPNSGHTDHTREYAPLLARFAGNDGSRHDGPLADVGASVLHWLTGHDAPDLPGDSFV